MIALGCDHGGINLKKAIMKYLDERNVEYKDFGSYNDDSVDYPIYAYKVANAVASGEFELGILCCGTGIGISMAANKVKGNILCMGGRVTSEEDAVKFADIFLNTPFSSDEERHTRRVQMLSDIENGKFSAE